MTTTRLIAYSLILLLEGGAALATTPKVVQTGDIVQAAQVNTKQTVANKPYQTTIQMEPAANESTGSQPKATSRPNPRSAAAVTATASAEVLPAAKTPVASPPSTPTSTPTATTDNQVFINQTSGDCTYRGTDGKTYRRNIPGC